MLSKLLILVLPYLYAILLHLMKFLFVPSFDLLSNVTQYFSELSNLKHHLAYNLVPCEVSKYLWKDTIFLIGVILMKQRAT